MADRPPFAVRLVRRALRAPATPPPLDHMLGQAEAAGVPPGPRLNVGSGSLPLDGWVNADLGPRPGVAVRLDATGGLPFGDETLSLVLAKDVIEHVDHVALIREIHRVLQPGGVAILSTPHYTSRFLWVDPTHRRGFSVDSFDYFATDFASPNDYYFDFVFGRLESVTLTFGWPRRYHYHQWLETWANRSRARLRWYEETIVCRIVPGLDLWVVLRK